MKSPRVILASASARRKELLGQIISQFDICSADIDETPLIAETPSKLVARLAKSKAKKVFSENPTCIVIGSDTIVTLENQIFGKPRDENDSMRMLKALSGNSHTVMTAVAFYAPQRAIKQVELDKSENNTQFFSCLVKTQVEFACLNEQEIRKYWRSREPHDKAGSYAIQGIGGQFVKSINGSYSAVVGLPLCETKQILNQLGVME